MSDDEDANVDIGEEDSPRMNTLEVPAFVVMPSGEERDQALRVWCIDCLRGENGTLYVDHWQIAADLERYIKTGEVSGKPKLKVAK